MFFVMIEEEGYNKGTSSVFSKAFVSVERHKWKCSVIVITFVVIVSFVVKQFQFQFPTRSEEKESSGREDRMKEMEGRSGEKITEREQKMKGDDKDEETKQRSSSIMNKKTTQCLPWEVAAKYWLYTCTLMELV